MSDEDKQFVEMPTLTITPQRKKSGLPKGVIILGAAIMIIGLIVIIVALLSSGG